MRLLFGYFTLLLSAGLCCAAEDEKSQTCTKNEKGETVCGDAAASVTVETVDESGEAESEKEKKGSKKQEKPTKKCCETLKEWIEEAERFSSKFDEGEDHVTRLFEIRNKIVELQPKRTDYLPSAEIDEDEIEHNFKEWVKETYHLTGSKIVALEDGVVKIRAKRDYKEKDVILKVSPHKAISSARNKKWLKCLGDIKVEDQRIPIVWNLANLTVVILSEMYEEHSKFRPYLDTFPRDPGHVLRLKFEELKKLNLTEDGYSIGSLFLHEELRVYSRLYQRLQNNTDCVKKLKMPLEKFTLDAFLWAASIATMNFYDTSFESEDFSMLFFHNQPHSTNNPNVEIQFVPDEVKDEKKNETKNRAMVEMVALKDIKKGELLTRTMFRTKSDGILALGRAVGDFQVVFPVEIRDIDRNATEKRQMLQGAGAGGPKLCIRWPDEYKLLDPRRGLGFDRVIDIAGGHAGIEMTKDALVMGWKFVKQQIKRRLAVYEHEVKNFKLVRGDSGTSGPTKFVYAVLEADYNLLRAALERIDEILASFG